MQNSDPGRPHPRAAPPTIDMTLAGEVLAPPSLWTRLARLWQGLPRGSVPLILVAVVTVAIGAVLVLGFLLLAIPAVLAAGLIALLFRGTRRL